MKYKINVNLEKTARNSSIELLRIFSMLLIIGHHALYHGCSESLIFATDFRTLFIQGFSAFGSLGNYIFVYISSWFLIDSLYSNKKLYSIWKQVFFYSIIFVFIMYILKIECIETSDLSFSKIGIKQLISYCFPFLTGKYWFASCYIIFYCFSPYYAILVKNMDERIHLKLVLMLILFTLILPIIPLQNISWLFGGNLLIFVTIYFVCAYCKIYKKKLFNNRLSYLLVSFFCMFFIIGWRICITYHFGQEIDKGNELFVKSGAILNLFTSMYSIINLFLAYCLFYFFSSFNFTSNIINKLGSSVLGVYLIHDNPLVRGLLWNKIFNMEVLSQSALFPILFIAIIICVFMICSVLDIIRQFLFGFFSRVKR
ncbi:acyltransferase [uncultured Treponema sp.]|uniref:acyltransferase family protein n=1 Tax=uncultured Treponema sp. TaxID=162155 RepID=UPI0025998DBB|nr:acyltransferase [uncultured Treponema sp.]